MMHLVPMTEAEFETYLQRALADYAADHVRVGNWRAEEAADRAAAQLRHLLPDGVHTPDHFLYTMRVDEIDQAVGMIWFGVIRRGIKPRLFVFDILVYEEFRRRGFGTQAMQAMEQNARDQGLETIELHVFGDNHGAQTLYEQLGYVVTDVSMAKKLST